ncbi:DUF2490 domain-containing protein [Flavobacterium urocaniciphilum]|uniref:DUF2490 domain-containing protein n=1 Tax=Flavobacterium urocaniciphilum TaxID=1299341 RepID=A0A1H8Z8K6_9FLAO|nr:DUF2490 domain-containing protein [Flavobacterium urocaniciphilum]SEP60607.1 Protein of unknown function [Flavobacterium urocaniciphilum]
MKKLIYLNLFVFFTIFNLSAQTNKVDQFNGWIFYTGNHKLSDKWGLHTEYQFRRNDGFSSPMQNQVRLGIDYNINKSYSTSIGWSYIETFAYGDFAEEIPSKYNNYKFNEQRIWEQFIIKHEHVGRFHYDSRFRLEQRWIASFKNFGTASEPSFFRYDDPAEGLWKYRNRARYRFRMQVPLTKSEMKDNTLFLVAADEIFVNLGGHVTSNVFDQNRLYLALGWRFTKDTNIQLGYMNQFIEKGDGLHKENNHTMQVALTHNIDFSKLFKK